MMSGLEFARAAACVRRELGQAHRFAHVVRVARFAEQLAVAHGENSYKARIAGLYHDLARLYSAERLLEECQARRMPIDTFESGNPIVLHARLGAEIARERFGIHDESILSAIRKHTVAAEQMSRLDIIVYLADALEPGRAYTERTSYATLARHDLTAAMSATIESTIAYLTSRNFAIAPQTLAARARFAAGARTSVSPTLLETGSVH